MTPPSFNQPIVGNTATDIYEVRPKLWIGSLQGVTQTLKHDPSFFTHAVSCIEDCPELKPGIFQLHLEIADDPKDSLLTHLNTVYEFIDKALRSDGKVVVHCELGISRSAALIAGYLLRQEKTNVKLALQSVYLASPKSRVNPWFVQDLMQWQIQQMLENSAALQIHPSQAS